MESAKSNGGVKAIQFAHQVIHGRWFMMFASFLIMSGAGATYVFGVYSSEIKTSLGYDQKTLNLLGVFKDLGAIMGVISGVVAELTPTWFVLIVGAGMNFFGYFMIWLSVTNKIPKPKVWMMCLYIFTGANSQAFANTGVLVACLHNFPQDRGIMLGLLKGFTGLSGALMYQIYLAVYGNDSKSLILLIGWLPAAVSIIFLYTIRVIKSPPRPDERKVFYHLLYIAVSLALFLMVITIIQKRVSFSHSAYVVTATVVSLFLILPLIIAVREELLLWNSAKQPSPPSLPTVETHSQSENESAEVPLTNQKGNVFSLVNIFKTPERGQDFTIMQGLFNVDMLIILVTIFCGYGTNLAAMDNLGQIGESLGYKPLAVGTAISLVSIWNFCGRVSAGFVSEVLLMKFKFPRPLLITVVLLLSCFGQLLIAFPFPGSLYLASVMVGFSYGAHLTLIYTIISELFGLKHYATLFNWGQLSSPLGSYVFNVRVAGVIYDKEAMKQLALKGLNRHDVKELTCIGKQCYKLSFVILAAASFLGGLASLVIVFRTYVFYKGDIYKKFREDAEMASVTNATQQ